jgi:hypothetical protein
MNSERIIYNALILNFILASHAYYNVLSMVQNLFPTRAREIFSLQLKLTVLLIEAGAQDLV